ncbi:MAG: hypothetical protein K9L30_12500 [Desulfobacterales bacterium]|nr:hypothetical protein [Desulfobacterales bacterium]
MLDVSVSYNKYKFLGYEFLTWLWFIIENDQKKLQSIDKELVALEIGNKITLENSSNNKNETIVIKGDDAGLEEGMLSLKKGADVKDINLVYKSGDFNWQFTLKGESFSFEGLKVPETAPIESEKDIEGSVIEKNFLYNKAIKFIDDVYMAFLNERLSEKWENNILNKIKQWINIEYK